MGLDREGFYDPFDAEKDAVVRELKSGIDVLAFDLEPEQRHLLELRRGNAQAMSGSLGGKDAPIRLQHRALHFRAARQGGDQGEFGREGCRILWRFLPRCCGCGRPSIKRTRSMGHKLAGRGGECCAEWYGVPVVI